MGDTVAVDYLQLRDTITADYLQLLEGLKWAVVVFIQLWVNASATIPTVYSSATLAETVSARLQLWRAMVIRVGGETVGNTDISGITACGNELDHPKIVLESNYEDANLGANELCHGLRTQVL